MPQQKLFRPEDVSVDNIIDAVHQLPALFAERGRMREEWVSLYDEGVTNAYEQAGTDGGTVHYPEVLLKAQARKWVLDKNPNLHKGLLQIETTIDAIILTCNSMDHVATAAPQYGYSRTESLTE